VIVAATFALGGEFAAWRRLRPFRRCADGPLPAYETRVGRVTLRVVLTGIGQRAATAAVTTVFQDRPDVCIASGLAGGLNAALRVADIVAAVTVRDRDGRRIDGDPRLLALAVRRGAATVDMYTSPTVVVSAEQKRRMSVVADAVDMESMAILGESSQLGIPCIAIRAISDPASVDVPLDLNQTLTDEGRFSPVRMIAALARRPQAVPGLVRLGLDGRRAAAALAAFLDGYVERVAASSIVSPTRDWLPRQDPGSAR
jgi:adenosylhomocysteine nucleosidase